MKKFAMVLAMFMGCASVSQAGILLEPYLGMEMGKYTTDSSGDGKTEFTNLGARVAYTLPVFFWVGLDMNVGMSGKIKPDNTSSYDAKRTSVGAVVGVDLPILLRGWLAYGFSNEIKGEDTLNTKIKGTYTKVGIGFTGLPFISLNLEMIKDDFKDTSNDLGSGDADFKHDSYMLSVSLPLEF